MAGLVRFVDNGHVCFSRVDLPSGDPIFISVGPAGVVVKISRLGLLGTRLYYTPNMAQAADTARALNMLLHQDWCPHSITNPVLRAFTNTALQALSAPELAVLLSGAPEVLRRREAATKVATQPMADAEPSAITGPPTFGIRQPDGSVLWGGNGRKLPDKRIQCRKCGHEMVVRADITEIGCERCHARIQPAIILC